MSKIASWQKENHPQNTKFKINIIYEQVIVVNTTLNSDGHQFNIYQQTEQSPLILNEFTEHKNTTIRYKWSWWSNNARQKCPILFY